MPLFRFLYILQLFVFFPIRISLCFTVIYYNFSEDVHAFMEGLWKKNWKNGQDLRNIEKYYTRSSRYTWCSFLASKNNSLTRRYSFNCIRNDINSHDYLQILVKHCLRYKKTIKAFLP